MMIQNTQIMNRTPRDSECSMPLSLRFIRMSVILLLPLLIFSCWKRQKIDVAGPEMPSYELYGEARYMGDSLLAIGLDIQITQVEVYQGDFLEPMFTVTDSVGSYSFSGLFRGRYSLRASQGGLLVFEEDVGLINFDDRNFNIEVPRAIHLIQQEISFRPGTEVRGLSVTEDRPLALVFNDGREKLQTEELEMVIIPATGSHWQHSGLAERGNGEYGSIRRQIDTTVVDGDIRVSSPQYYLTIFDVTTEQHLASDESLSGEQLTNTSNHSGYWLLQNNFANQKLLFQTDLLGVVQQSRPLANNQAGVFSLVENDDTFWTVDTSTSSIWMSSLSDSLVGRLIYKVFDTSDALVRPESFNPVKYIIPTTGDGMFIARRNGVWSAEVLGR